MQSQHVPAIAKKGTLWQSKPEQWEHHESSLENADSFRAEALQKGVSCEEETLPALDSHFRRAPQRQRNFKCLCFWGMLSGTEAEVGTAAAPWEPWVQHWWPQHSSCCAATCSRERCTATGLIQSDEAGTLLREKRKISLFINQPRRATQE